MEGELQRILNMLLKETLLLPLVNMPQGVSLLSIRKYTRVVDCIRIQDQKDMSIIRQNTILRVRITRKALLSVRNVIGLATGKKNIRNALTATQRWSGIQ